MKTGFRGTFVISWSQTEIDGVDAPPVTHLRTGAAWRWRGEAVRVDGASGVLPLGEALGEAELRARAARGVRRLLSAVEANVSSLDAVAEPEAPLFEDSFVVTDGRDTWTVTLIAAAGGRPLCMFVGEIPPRSADLWVVRSEVGGPVASEGRARRGGMICFTPGTVISTPEGPRRVEQLIEGDLIDTADDMIGGTVREGDPAVGRDIGEVFALGEVGAKVFTDPLDLFAGFSNYGPVLDLLAPGVEIPSLLPSEDGTVRTRQMSGTSAAAPHVAGAAARYLATHPSATPQHVRDALVAHSRSTVSRMPSNTTDRSVWVEGLTASSSADENENNEAETDED